MKYKYNGQWYDLTVKALDSMPIGSIIAFPSSSIPNGWLECNGQSISQSNYPELYALIGSSTPNYKGRVLVGQDTSQTEFDTLGETGGSKFLQEHYHNVGKGAGLGVESAWGQPSEYNSNMGTFNTGTAGYGDSGNLQPYSVIKWIIKASNTTTLVGSVVNQLSNSTTDTYSCNYVNNKTVGTVLFSGSNTSGDITLSDSIANYSRVDVTFKSRLNIYNTFSLNSPNGKMLGLMSNIGEGMTNYFIISSCTLNFYGTTAARGNERLVTLQDGANSGIGVDTSYYTLTITEIIGYK